jgi:hypothetical protein
LAASAPRRAGMPPPHQPPRTCVADCGHACGGRPQPVCGHVTDAVTHDRAPLVLSSARQGFCRGRYTGISSGDGQFGAALPGLIAPEGTGRYRRTGAARAPGVGRRCKDGLEDGCDDECGRERGHHRDSHELAPEPRRETPPACRQAEERPQHHEQCDPSCRAQPVPLALAAEAERHDRGQGRAQERRPVHVSADVREVRTAGGARGLRSSAHRTAPGAASARGRREDRGSACGRLAVRPPFSRTGTMAPTSVQSWCARSRLGVSTAATATWYSAGICGEPVCRTSQRRGAWTGSTYAVAPPPRRRRVPDAVPATSDPHHAMNRSTAGKAEPPRLSSRGGPCRCPRGDSLHTHTPRPTGLMTLRCWAAESCADRVTSGRPPASRRRSAARLSVHRHLVAHAHALADEPADGADERNGDQEDRGHPRIVSDGAGHGGGHEG